MQHKKLFLLIFVLVAAIQIYVPAKMVYNSEMVIREGSVYKFKIQPIDPSDPFRGKYITLRFDIDHFNIDSTDTWLSGEDVYVLLTTDSLGYAKIDMISRKAPASSIDYVKAKAGWSGTSWRENEYRLNIVYSFDRFYMEESKVPDAEVAYRDASRNNKVETYALVHIKDGSPIVKDVLINEVSIRELVIRNNTQRAAKVKS